MSTKTFTHWLSLRAYGVISRTLFGSRTHPKVMRRRFERFGATSRRRLLARHPGLVFAEHAVGPLSVESVHAGSPERAVLYLHGGAFVMGSPASYRSRAARMAYRCRAELFVPDYRLAPEHPFPAALEDAVAAWRHLRRLRPGRPLFVAGDSAGGGLALSLMVRLRDLGEPLPDGAVLLSPSVDLAEPGGRGGESGTDLWLTREHLRRWFRHYVGQADPAQPLVSPIRANLTGLPPFLLLAGADELLLEEGRHMVDRALSAGVDAQLLVGEGMQHDWPLTLPWLPESRHAWKVVAGFLDDPPARSARPAAVPRNGVSSRSARTHAPSEEARS
jgi:acetyl esterase/lipase